MPVFVIGTCAEHCWHMFRGFIHMVVPDGHVVQKCCRCPATRTEHIDHLADRHHRPYPRGPCGRWSVTRCVV